MTAPMTAPMNARQRVWDRLRGNPKRPQPYGAHVAGTDLGDFYKDSNGHMWKYEKRTASLSDAVLGNVDQRGLTDAYGGVVSPWFKIESGFHTDAHDRINPWIDKYAKAHATDLDWLGDDEPGTTTKKKKPSGGGGSGSSLPTAPHPAAPPSPKKPSALGYVALVSAPAAGFLLAGPIGAGVGAVVGIGALIFSRK